MRWLDRFTKERAQQSVEEKLESIRSKGKSDPPMEPEDVTGIQRLALRELETAMRANSAEDKRAAEALKRTCEGLCSVAPEAQ